MPDPRAEGPLDLLPRWPLVVVIALVVLAITTVSARWYIGKRAGRQLIVPSTDTTGPGNPGVPYADLVLTSGDHTIRAWWVRAPTLDSAGPAVLLFHPNRSTLGDQAGIQQVLYRAGISSLAFDYSGFGKSEGDPTPAALRVDARAAFAVFTDSARAAGRGVLLGTSLGAAVLLDAIAELQAGVDGVVLVGAFTSARDLAVQSGRVPRLASWPVPNLYDHLTAIRRLSLRGQCLVDRGGLERVANLIQAVRFLPWDTAFFKKRIARFYPFRLTRPLLVVHSAQDEVFPIEHAEQLLEAASGPKRLERLDRGGHATYLSSDADWLPVIEFIRRGLDVRP
ncbi:MAG: alpha/beta hydrolase [Gemmatimonadetes bacterium]|nr:alpha/beta hydrolase [Gemmatimonadota bacterium]